MNRQLTQQERETAASQVRDCGTRAGVQPHMLEQYAQEILSGARDAQLQALAQQQQSQQPPQPGPANTFSFPTPFGNIEIPTMPMMQVPAMPTVQLPAMQPIQFPPMLQPPQVFIPSSPPLPLPQAPRVFIPSSPPLPSPQVMIQPFSPPPTLIGPMFPTPSRPTEVNGTPNIFADRTTFAGGHVDRHNVNVSGRHVNGNFSYSSSGTSLRYNSADAQLNQQLPTYQSVQYPPPQHALAGGPQAQPGHPPRVVLTPHQDLRPANQQQQYNTLPVQPATALPPVQASATTTAGAAQNQRMASTLQQQLDERTYFSSPPGAQDHSSGETARQTRHEGYASGIIGEAADSDEEDIERIDAQPALSPLPTPPASGAQNRATQGPPVVTEGPPAPYGHVNVSGHEGRQHDDDLASLWENTVQGRPSCWCFEFRDPEYDYVLRNDRTARQHERDTGLRRVSEQ